MLAATAGCLLAARVRAGDASSKPAARESPAFRISVDPRVELMSIIFRLAGNREYGMGRIASYTKQVDEHFGAFKNHKVIQLARRLRARRGVSYDAPMSLAVHLTDAFELKEKVPFDPHPVGLDRRWRLSEVRAFLQAARSFVRQSKFQEFFQAHKGLYDLAAERMTETMNKHGQLNWFERFFGQPPAGKFHIFLGMLNGPCCYGARVKTDKQREVYCILGVWNRDNKGMPSFPKSMLPTVMHEFGHSYVNPLVYARADEFEEAGKKIFPRIKKAMKRQAYGNWLTVVHESVLRACIVRCRYGNEGAAAAYSEVLDNQRRGFAWVGALSKLLSDYERQRDKYPTFEAFMPRVVEFFDQYAAGLATSQPATHPTQPATQPTAP